ncbi:MAG: hypothetical protein ACI8UO_006054 [Verrucomicrobiales bacterium]|jgi:hypothetical protein
MPPTNPVYVLTRSHFSMIATVIVALSAACGSCFGESPSLVSLPGAPEPVTEADFAELKANSPFIRSLNLSDSLVLTGIARIDGRVFATVRDRESKEIMVLSEAANKDGWRIVSLDGDRANLDSMTAQISAGGGGVFSIRFDQQQLAPKGVRTRIPPEQAARIAQAARDYRRGISGDGFRGAPPPELADKLSKLSEDQRGNLIYEIGEMRNRGVSSEERQKVFVQMVDRALRDRR